MTVVCRFCDPGFGVYNLDVCFCNLYLRTSKRDCFFSFSFQVILLHNSISISCSLHLPCFDLFYSQIVSPLSALSANSEVSMVFSFSYLFLLISIPSFSFSSSIAPFLLSLLIPFSFPSFAPFWLCHVLSSLLCCPLCLFSQLLARWWFYEYVGSEKCQAVSQPNKFSFFNYFQHISSY